MLRLGSDEDVNGKIIEGLRLHAPHLDLESVRDVGMTEHHDREVLEWAAREDRVLITHDRKTLVGYAYDRVRSGLPMPGVLAITATVTIGHAIEDIRIAAECYEMEEMRDQVKYIPLR